MSSKLPIGQLRKPSKEDLSYLFAEAEIEQIGFTNTIQGDIGQLEIKEGESVLFEGDFDILGTIKLAKGGKLTIKSAKIGFKKAGKLDVQGMLIVRNSQMLVHNNAEIKIQGEGAGRSILNDLQIQAIDRGSLKFTVENCSDLGFKKVKLENTGGIQFRNCKKVTIEDSKILGGKKLGIEINRCQDFKLSKIELQLSPEKAILQLLSSTNLRIADCQIDAQNKGQGIRLLRSKNCDLSKVTVKNGDALQGGGIKIEHSEVQAKNVLIKDCKGKSGGGIYLDNSELKGEQLSIENCQAEVGGGSFLTNKTKIEIISIQDCEAEKEGGGIYMSKRSTVLKAEIQNCKARNGGGIYAKNATINTPIISACTANGQGPFIRLEESILEMDGLSFPDDKILRDRSSKILS